MTWYTKVSSYITILTGVEPYDTMKGNTILHTNIHLDTICSLQYTKYFKLDTLISVCKLLCMQWFDTPLICFDILINMSFSSSYLHQYKSSTLAIQASFSTIPGKPECIKCIGIIALNSKMRWFIAKQKWKVLSI